MNYLARLCHGTAHKIKEILNLGSLPDYIIIGVQKGGSSALHIYLSEHPHIFGSTKKEIHFFDHNYDKGIDWYKSQFPILRKYRKILSGEASPSYVYLPFIAKRIHKVLPEIKFILLLRNPVDRAYSNYNMRCQRGGEEKSFEQAILSEQKRFSENNYRNNLNNRLYLARGRYVEQLEIWYNYFRKDQIIILKSEDLLLNPKIECSKVFRFLDIFDYEIKSVEPIHKRKYDKKMNSSTREYLNNYYKPYNKRLYDLVGRDFEW